MSIRTVRERLAGLVESAVDVDGCVAYPKHGRVEAGSALITSVPDRYVERSADSFCPSGMWQLEIWVATQATDVQRRLMWADEQISALIGALLDDSTLGGAVDMLAVEHVDAPTIINTGGGDVLVVVATTTRFEVL